MKEKYIGSQMMQNEQRMHVISAVNEHGHPIRVAMLRDEKLLKVLTFEQIHDIAKEYLKQLKALYHPDTILGKHPTATKYYRHLVHQADLLDKSTEKTRKKWYTEFLSARATTALYTKREKMKQTLDHKERMLVFHQNQAKLHIFEELLENMKNDKKECSASVDEITNTILKIGSKLLYMSQIEIKYYLSIQRGVDPVLTEDFLSISKDAIPEKFSQDILVLNILLLLEKFIKDSEENCEVKLHDIIQAVDVTKYHTAIEYCRAIIVEFDAKILHNFQQNCEVGLEQVGSIDYEVEVNNPYMVAFFKDIPAYKDFTAEEITNITLKFLRATLRRIHPDVNRDENKDKLEKFIPKFAKVIQLLGEINSSGNKSLLELLRYDFFQKDTSTISQENNEKLNSIGGGIREAMSLFYSKIFEILDTTIKIQGEKNILENLKSERLEYRSNLQKLQQPLHIEEQEIEIQKMKQAICLNIDFTSEDKDDLYANIHLIDIIFDDFIKTNSELFLLDQQGGMLDEMTKQSVKKVHKNAEVKYRIVMKSSDSIIHYISKILLRNSHITHLNYEDVENLRSRLKQEMVLHLCQLVLDNLGYTYKIDIEKYANVKLQEHRCFDMASEFMQILGLYKHLNISAFNNAYCLAESDPNILLQIAKEMEVRFIKGTPMYRYFNEFECAEIETISSTLERDILQEITIDCIKDELGVLLRFGLNKNAKGPEEKRFDSNKKKNIISEFKNFKRSWLSRRSTFLMHKNYVIEKILEGKSVHVKNQIKIKEIVEKKEDTHYVRKYIASLVTFKKPKSDKINNNKFDSIVQELKDLEKKIYIPERTGNYKEEIIDQLETIYRNLDSITYPRLKVEFNKSKCKNETVKTDFQEKLDSLYNFISMSKRNKATLEAQTLNTKKLENDLEQATSRLDNTQEFIAQIVDKIVPTNNLLKNLQYKWNIYEQHSGKILDRHYSIQEVQEYPPKSQEKSSQVVESQVKSIPNWRPEVVGNVQNIIGSMTFENFLVMREKYGTNSNTCENMLNIEFEEQILFNSDFISRLEGVATPGSLFIKKTGKKVKVSGVVFGVR